MDNPQGASSVLRSYVGMCRSLQGGANMTPSLLEGWSAPRKATRCALPGHPGKGRDQLLGVGVFPKKCPDISGQGTCLLRIARISGNGRAS